LPAATGKIVPKKAEIQEKEMSDFKLKRINGFGRIFVFPEEVFYQ